MLSIGESGNLATAMKCFIAFLFGGLVVWLTSCSEKPATPPPSPAATASKATAVSTQIFQVKGVVVAVKPEEKTVRIRHEEIPGYMEAMTMPFEVRDTNELAGVSDGDTVSFRMLVTETDGWIDQIKKLDVPTVNTLPANSGIRIVRDVEPLEVGNVLPEYTFTNQLGKAVSLSQFRGKAMAFTFIFTRCPFPTFCPLMSNNFRAVRDALKNNSSAPTNWHLLTISFDPEFDTPEVLKRYSASYNADPANWSFLTGTLVDITALSEQVGLQFWREPGGNISHNLRTVVVDAQGRIQKIYPENKWTTEELTDEIIKAAGAK